MEELLPLIIQLLAGAAGGTAAGSLMKDASLGKLGDALAGVVGGGIGGHILALLGVMATGELDLAGIITSVASGGAGGGALIAIIGVVKKLLAK